MSVELTATATVPTNATLEVTVHEDQDGDGVAENAETKSISDGTALYDYANIPGDPAYDYWLTVVATPGSAATLETATLETQTVQYINPPVSVTASSSPSPEAGAYVSGTVTSGGAGAEGATVRAIRQSDGAQLASATTAADGTYEMKLTPNQGDVHITVEWTDSNGEEYNDESYPYLTI